MRRLLLLVCAISFLDVVLYTALVPLLPRFADEHDLSKTGSGLLVAAYAAGILVAALPGGLVAARLGPRRAVVGGLLLFAVASLGFAFSESAWELGISRLVQGLSGSLTWAGGLAWLVAGTPRGRRGEAIGTAIGAAIFGALLGPVVGAVADVAGPRPTFAGVAGVAVALVVWSLRTPAAPAEPQPLSAALAALREVPFLGALWVMLLPALLFGVLSVLVPLELDADGFGAIAIGAVFLGAAACEAVMNIFVGRFSDRRGRRRPLQVSAAAAVAVSVALAWTDHPAALVPLVIAAAISFGSFYTPATALLSDRAEQLGLAQGLAFGLSNLAWAGGNVIGPAAGGALAKALGDAVPYLIGAGLCAVTLVGIVAGARHRVLALAFTRRAD